MKSERAPEDGIGGAFGVPPEISLRPFNQLEKYIPTGNRIWLQKGRDAVRMVCQKLKLGKGDYVLLPDWICNAGIVAPFRECGVKIRFYNLDINFDPDFSDIDNKLMKETRALLINHFFGFPQPLRKIVDLCVKENLFLIEDCAQAFLSRDKNGNLLGSTGDASIFSFRKSLPLPDGALLVTSDKDYPRPNSTVSPISQWVMERLDYKSIIKRRRENFKYLLDGVKRFEPVFDKLPKGTVPLFFPVWVQSRDYVLWKLAKEKVYCAPHYPNILSVPCDQRYTIEEMEYVARCLNRL